MEWAFSPRNHRSRLDRMGPSCYTPLRTKKRTSVSKQSVYKLNGKKLSPGIQTGDRGHVLFPHICSLSFLRVKVLLLCKVAGIREYFSLSPSQGDVATWCRSGGSSVWVCLKREDPAGKYSRTLAWKIPWMEEPGRLQSMGSLRVGYDWATSLSLFTFMHWRRKWQPTPVFLPGESQGWGRTESDTTEVT